jgi:threonine/homoserine efflux transporter RhtA
MDRHVNFLAVLWTLWGALTILIGVSTMLLAIGALAAIFGPGGEAVTTAASLIAAAFALTGGFTLLWGFAHVWAGTLVRRRVSAGRTLSLGLAVVNLLVLPFGTALGGYALWILLTSDGRRLFEVPSASAVSTR